MTSKAKIVEFVEPGAWKPRKVNSESNKSLSAVKRVEMPSFAEMKKSVLELGIQGKSKKERLQMEEQRLIKLGCSPRKNPKAPLPILKGMLRKKREREKSQRDAERAAEIITAQTAKRRRKATK